jgi:hypothetical protein
MIINSKRATANVENELILLKSSTEINSPNVIINWINIGAFSNVK